MFSLLYGNWQAFFTHLSQATGTYAYGHPLFAHAVFFTVFFALFIIDVSFFCFGYLFEIPGKSTVKSVDPTFFGWLVALLCYHPFSINVTGLYFGERMPDRIFTFQSAWLVYGSMVAVLLSYSIYVWATVALGPRGSNLTNRGIVDWGPYRFVRHPAYMFKCLAWILTGIPYAFAIGPVALGGLSFTGLQVVNATIAVHMVAATVLYYIRALTEERHLINDPDYQAYCQKVRWRYIPGVH
jgi:protein-S-isoprenylcysteine O-methyltransferase Ste14